MTKKVTTGRAGQSKHASKFSMTCMRAPLKRTRLGELLVTNGKISTSQLKQALSLQKSAAKPLGEILIKEKMIRRHQLGGVLFKQFALRSAATILVGMMSLTSLAAKKAWADMIQDVPAKISVSFNAGAQYGSPSYYPAIYGSSEKRSTNLKPFTKWSGMFAEFDRDLRNGKNKTLLAEWRTALKAYEGQDLKTMATNVNNMMNKKRYIVDSKNWGKSDYWSSPIDFLKRGGDCEDFAIAKYVALRALGVPEERLRVMIVQDTLKNIPHAVLVVYTGQGAYILDNQIKTLVSTSRGARYRPIYSINRTAWWLHTAPETTQVASAR